MRGVMSASHEELPTQADHPLRVLARGSWYCCLLSFSIVPTERHLTSDRGHATASHTNTCHLSTYEASSPKSRPRLCHHRGLAGTRCSRKELTSGLPWWPDG